MIPKRYQRASLAVALSALCGLGQAWPTDPPKSPSAAKLPPPVQLTAQEDHQRMLQLLKIKELRRGANPSDPNAPNAVNYDESKANPYPELPDPLVLKNGKPVATAEMWWKRRRPQIVEDFDREINGRVPANTPKVKWETTATDKQTVGDVAVVTRRLAGHVDNTSYPLISVDIQLTLTTPANAKRPVPVIMEFGFGGRGFGPPPGGRRGPTWQQQVLARGWGYAIIVPNSIQADSGAGLTRGIIGLVDDLDVTEATMRRLGGGETEPCDASCCFAAEPFSGWRPSPSSGTRPTCIYSRIRGIRPHSRESLAWGASSRGS